MPKTGDSNRVQLYIRENTGAFDRAVSSDTSTGWNEIRYTGEALEHQKTSEPSATIRADRMKDSVAELAAQTSGTIDFELTANTASVKTMFEGLIGNSFATKSQATATIDNPVAGSTSDLVAIGIHTGVTVGSYVRVTNATTPADDGVYRVTATTTGRITVDADLTDTDSCTVDFGSTLVNKASPDVKTYEIEKRFSDLDTPEYMYFGGQRVGQVSLNLAAQQRITGQASFDGRRGLMTETVNSATHTATSTQTDPMTASANVTELELDEGTTIIAPVQSLDITVNGNNRIKSAVGNKYPIDIGQGTIDMSGSFQFYFQDSAVFDLMESHTYFSMRLRMTDAAGNVFMIFLPRAVFTEGSPTASGENTDVVEPKGFIAVNDTTSGYGILVQDLPA
jgi:hypothetical protein